MVSLGEQNRQLYVTFTTHPLIDGNHSLGINWTEAAGAGLIDEPPTHVIHKRRSLPVFRNIGDEQEPPTAADGSTDNDLPNSLYPTSEDAERNVSYFGYQSYDEWNGKVVTFVLNFWRTTSGHFTGACHRQNYDHHRRGKEKAYILPGYWSSNKF